MHEVLFARQFQAMNIWLIKIEKWGIFSFGCQEGIAKRRYRTKNRINCSTEPGINTRRVKPRIGTTSQKNVYPFLFPVIKIGDFS